MVRMRGPFAADKVGPGELYPAEGSNLPLKARRASNPCRGSKESLQIGGFIWNFGEDGAVALSVHAAMVAVDMVIEDCMAAPDAA